jgi:hypothetical protein
MTAAFYECLGPGRLAALAQHGIPLLLDFEVMHRKKQLDLYTLIKFRPWHRQSPLGFDLSTGKGISYLKLSTSHFRLKQN